MIIDDQAVKTLAAIPSDQVNVKSVCELLTQRSQQWKDQWVAQLVQVIHDYDFAKDIESGLYDEPKKLCSC